MDQEWIAAIIVIAAITVSTAVAVVALLNHYAEQDRFEPLQQGTWNVELWNLQHGFRIDLEFHSTMVVGRYTLHTPEAQMQHIQMDNCISREHVLLYDQGGMLWAWNLSMVNPAMINGYRLDSPWRILPGIRMELGNSIFLVTRAEFTGVTRAS